MIGLSIQKKLESQKNGIAQSTSVPTTPGRTMKKNSCHT
jgi:hypothetical protein